MKDTVGVCARYEYDIFGRRSHIYNNDELEVWDDFWIIMQQTAV